jgi:5-formyltetrahydrofolate cyclo-ligase
MSDEPSQRPGFADHAAHGKGSLYPDEVIAMKVKAELRKRLRGLRRTAPVASCEERSNKIRERILLLPEVVRAKSVALFFPIEGRNEVDLRPLDAALRARGVVLGYPSIDPDTNVMTFRKVEDLSSLEERGKGFCEPDGAAPELAAPDVVVVPALAVAPSGHRLGYGAGYYDRMLDPQSGPAKDAFSVVVAYDYQLLMELPTLPHDVPARHVVTDLRDFAAEPVPPSPFT